MAKMCGCGQPGECSCESIDPALVAALDDFCDGQGLTTLSEVLSDPERYTYSPEREKVELTENNLVDLRERIQKAMKTLTTQREVTDDPVELSRISGKIEGLSLTLDYLRGYS